MKYKARSGIISIVLVLFTLLFFLLLPQELHTIYKSNIVVDYIAAMIIIVLLLIYSDRHDTGIFDPIYFISIIYLFMYFIAPIYDILMGEYYWFGYNLFPYGVKSSIIALLGYLSFYFFYTLKLKKKDTEVKPLNMPKINRDVNNPLNRTNLVAVILVMYGVCFAANVYYLLKNGFTSLLYILSLGLLGSDGTASEQVANIGFISMLSYSLPGTTLLYWEYGKSKALKIVLFFPMLILQVARGFRFFVIQIVVTFVAYYFIKRRKKIKLATLGFALGGMLVAVLLMTMFRDTMRTGSGMAFDSISRETLQEAFDAAFWENLRIYRNFYGMVNAIPSQQGYVYGRQIVIGTIVMVVPRMIWPGKISSYGGPGLVILIGSNLKGTGQAYPTIGEYYYAIGIVGVILFMAIYGIWAKKQRDKYMNSKDGLDIIIFALLLGCNLQLMIRGYFPSNFWYMLFSVLPIWIIKYLRKVKSYIVEG